MPIRIVIGALMLVVVVAALVSVVTASLMMPAASAARGPSGDSQPQWVALQFGDQRMIIRTDDISSVSLQDGRWVATMISRGRERPQRFLLTADSVDELCEMLRCWSPSR